LCALEIKINIEPAMRPRPGCTAATTLAVGVLRVLGAPEGDLVADDAKQRTAADGSEAIRVNFNVDTVAQLDAVVGDAPDQLGQGPDLAEQGRNVVEGDLRLLPIDGQQHDHGPLARTKPVRIIIHSHNGSDDGGDTVLAAAAAGNCRHFAHGTYRRISLRDRAKERQFGGIQRLAEHGLDHGLPSVPTRSGKERREQFRTGERLGHRDVDRLLHGASPLGLAA
jgi:hypothetical protein